MVKIAPIIALPRVVLDPATPTALHRQLYEQLRAAILTGGLTPGTRLPATRALARELGVSRTTAYVSYQQLLAEGYLEGRVGAGTHVARHLPETLLQVPTSTPGRAQSTPHTQVQPHLSRRGAALVQTPAMPAPSARQSSIVRPFRSGMPALDAFPQQLWTRLLARRARRSFPDLFGYQESAGYRPLREEIAAYLSVARGVHCVPEQVMIVVGAQSGLALAAQVLLNPGDAAWIEDPGYLGARGALRGAGARLIPVPVDEEGLDVEAGIARCPQARLAYVTPSHQFPLCVTMSLARRLALLDWAHQTSTWVLEDDYDSEYRYAGRPIPALHGLDDRGRVIYIGTFSKVLFPALRLGYLVIPDPLVDAFLAARRVADVHPPALEQAALADFMAEGHFSRHIRRMRTLYAERGAILRQTVAHELRGAIEVRLPHAGLHLVGWLPAGVDDRTIAQRAAGLGVQASPISHFGLEPLSRGALLLGFAAFPEVEIREGVRRLGKALGTDT